MRSIWLSSVVIDYGRSVGMLRSFPATGIRAIPMVGSRHVLFSFQAALDAHGTAPAPHNPSPAAYHSSYRAGQNPCVCYVFSACQCSVSCASARKRPILRFCHANYANPIAYQASSKIRTRQAKSKIPSHSADLRPFVRQCKTFAGFACFPWHASCIPKHLSTQTLKHGLCWRLEPF